jgi:hypothetical protein
MSRTVSVVANQETDENVVQLLEHIPEKLHDFLDKNMRRKKPYSRKVA